MNASVVPVGAGPQVSPEPRGNDVSPLLPGWYTLDEALPHLLGARCKTCGTYYFPKHVTFCRNPKCNGETFEQVKLSRSGTLWSWTNACYAPPEPFIAAEPYQPFAIAAVELAKEKMVVLGAVVQGVTVAQLKAGMKMELALEPLADGKVTWKWRPA
jgi:uncharacterized protein